MDAPCDVYVRGLCGEVEIDIEEGDITLTDITGPLIIKSNKGDVTMVFSEVNQESPTSVICNEGDIDITMPGESAVTFRLKTSSGEVFTDLEISEQENPFEAQFDRLVMRSPNNNFAWQYSYDIDDETGSFNLIEPDDIESIGIDKGNKRIVIREKGPLKRNRELVAPYFYGTRPEKYYTEALKLYSDNLGNFYLGHDFPFLMGLMYDFTGDMNGGGVEVGIKTEQGNIYLRKSE